MGCIIIVLIVFSAIELVAVLIFMMKYISLRNKMIKWTHEVRVQHNSLLISDRKIEKLLNNSEDKKFFR